MRLGRLPSRRVRARQLGCRLQRCGERRLVGGIDEHAGPGRHELGRTADPCRDHRPAARHRLEQCLAERLDQAGLADDVRRRDLLRNAVVGHAPHEHDARTPFELRP